MEREDGRGVLEISRRRGPFYSRYWNTLNALAVRSLRSFSSAACWCSSAVFYICWIYFYVCLGFFFFFTKRELNIVIMLYPVLFAIHHSILSHPSPSVSCCTSLCKDWAVQNGKDLKRVTQITLVFDDQLYEPYCKTHTHTPQGDGHRVLPKAILSISLTFAHFSGVKANLPHTRAHTQPSISCSVFLTLFLFTPSGTPF